MNPPRAPASLPPRESPHTGLPVTPGSDLEAILTVGQMVQELRREVDHIKEMVVRIAEAMDRTERRIG